MARFETLLDRGFQWEDTYTARLPTILVADSHEINRRHLRGILRTAPYRILEATSAEEAFAILGRSRVDLLVLDLMMPGLGGLEFCRHVKADRRTRFTPILVLTSLQGVENEIAGIESGADEFLLRPLNAAVVRTRIAAMLRQKAAIDSLEEAETILFALARAIEHRDNTTGTHCERLAIVSVSLGQALGLTRPELLALYRGGFLHDIGKVSIPDAILNKPGRLTDEEWEIMRTHTIKGEQICCPLKTLALVLPIIRNHHERWDGSGYPDRLRGADIPLLARILQVADIFDALTSVRPYKQAFTAEQALEEIENEAQRGWRDPELVALLREVVSGSPAISPDAVQASLENLRVALLQ